MASSLRLPSSPHPLRDGAARHARRAAACARGLAGGLGDRDRVAWHRAAATDRPTRPWRGCSTRRRIGRSSAAPSSSHSTPPARGHAQRGRAGPRDSTPAGGEMANDIGRMDVIAEMLVESEADRRPVSRGPPADGGSRRWGSPALAWRARMPACDPSVIAAVDPGGRRRTANDLGARAACSSPRRGAGGRIPASRSGPRSRRPPCSSLPRETIPGSPSSERSRQRSTSTSYWRELARRAASPGSVRGDGAVASGPAALWVGALDLASTCSRPSIAGLRREGRLGLLARSLIITPSRRSTSAGCPPWHRSSTRAFASGVETRQAVLPGDRERGQAISPAPTGATSIGAEASIRDVERVVLGRRPMASCRRRARAGDHRPRGRPQRRGVRGARALVRPGPSVLPRHVRSVARSPTSPLPRSRPVTRPRLRMVVARLEAIAFG
jgi:hypothetical protein